MDFGVDLGFPQVEPRVVQRPLRSLNSAPSKKKPMKPRGSPAFKTEIDVKRHLLLTDGAEGHMEWALDGFPEETKYWLLGNGLRSHLQKQKDRGLAYSELRDGIVPNQGAWRRDAITSDVAMAIMAALADEIAEMEPGLEESEVRLRAEKLALELRRDEREKLKELPAVLHYLAKLRGEVQEESVLDRMRRLKAKKAERETNAGGLVG